MYFCCKLNNGLWQVVQILKNFLKGIKRKVPLYNQRTDYHLNGPAFGVNFRPAIHRNLNLIVEYDAKTVNVGATYSLWADHFNLMVEFQEGKYLSAGLVYKVNLLGNNRWNAKLFDY